MSNDYSAGTLTVGIKADTGPLTKGLGKGRKDVKGFVGEVDRELGDGFTKTFSRLAGIAAGFFAFDKIKGFIGSTLESIDDLGKQADKLRVSAEQLQAYQYAANLADVETSTLNNAIQKMTLNLSAATEESGPALDWLAKMNLSAKELQKTDVGTAFERIGSALERIPEADRLKAVSDIFGKGNTDLVNLFAEGLGKSVDEFERLGLAVSNEDVARVKEFNDSWEKLSKSLGAIGRDFVIDVTPAATRAIEEIREALGMIAEGDVDKTAKRQNVNVPWHMWAVSPFAAAVSNPETAGTLALPFTNTGGMATQARQEFQRKWLSQKHRWRGVNVDGDEQGGVPWHMWAASPLAAAVSSRGVNVDGVTREQGTTQINVLGQIRDAVQNQRPTQTIELKPAGAL